MNPTADLLPCPFCGNVPTFNHHNGQVSVTCPKDSLCDGKEILPSFSYDKVSEWVKHWNTRHGKSVSEEISDLKKEIANLHSDGVAAYHESRQKTAVEAVQIAMSIKEPDWETVEALKTYFGLSWAHTRQIIENIGNR